ncbi:MAG: hypothetical protein Q7V31_03665 [Parvibaculum sp.]|uniref:hypothetical protein n=1 Tax=Parvibaculum sp. TaxID=2024848 RepID=UPI00271A2571|nr:hypothetical protein [Parvibaculum sp.]MDO8838000.1 hypothetical protein [Parvibaculum sp.]
MTDFAIISFLWSLAYFVATLLVATTLLRWFDWTLGIRFKRDVWEKLNENPLALAVYHGLRLLAVFLLGAAFVS